MSKKSANRYKLLFLLTLPTLSTVFPTAFSTAFVEMGGTS